MRKLIIWFLTPFFKYLSNSTFNELLRRRRQYQLRVDSPADIGTTVCGLPEQYGYYLVELSAGEEWELWYHPNATIDPDYHYPEAHWVRSNNEVVGIGHIIKDSKGKDNFIMSWKKLEI